jgi:hypothetical protein
MVEESMIRLLWRWVRILWFGYFGLQTVVSVYGLLAWVYTGRARVQPPIGHQESNFFGGLVVLLLVTGFYATISGALWWSLRRCHGVPGDQRGSADAAHRNSER